MLEVRVKEQHGQQEAEELMMKAAEEDVIKSTVKFTFEKPIVTQCSGFYLVSNQSTKLK